MGDGVGDNTADRLQNQDRQRGGDQRGQQWVRISSTDSGSSVRRRFSTQHINATTSSTAITPPRPGCNASPNNVICASAGLENAGHDAAHRLRAAEYPRGVDPDQNVHDGEHRAAEDRQQPQHVRVVHRQLAGDVGPFQQVDDAGDQARGDKRRDQRNKDIGQFFSAPLIGAAYFAWPAPWCGPRLDGDDGLRATAQQFAHGVHHLGGGAGPTIN